MPKTTTKPNQTLINRNSFFDIRISCRSVFDRKIVNQIEDGCQGDEPQPLIALQNIAKLAENSKSQDLVEQTIFYRNSFFYLILTMDYLTDQMQNMMIVQMMAGNIIELYCENLDKLIKTNFDFVQEEMDKCITFQTSDSCATPNIIKENFSELFKNEELLKLVESQFKNVNFEGAGEEMLATDEEMQATFNELMKNMEVAKVNAKKSKN